jgi:DNA-binding CsgD family transcriptional regulator
MTPSEPTNDGAVPVESQIWEALTTEPSVAVHILDCDLRVLYCNETMARDFLGMSASEVMGRPLAEVVGEEVVEDTKRAIERLSAGDGPLGLRRIWQGRQIVGTFRRIAVPSRKDDHFLVITRHLGTRSLEDVDLPVIDAETVLLGPLEVLSPRELEVLCLLGHGLAIKEIGRVLHRSPRTIEAHRHNIGRKLEESDRVKLAQIAVEAGLTLADAGRQRDSG